MKFSRVLLLFVMTLCVSAGAYAAGDDVVDTAYCLGQNEATYKAIADACAAPDKITDPKLGAACVLSRKQKAMILEKLGKDAESEAVKISAAKALSDYDSCLSTGAVQAIMEKGCNATCIASIDVPSCYESCAQVTLNDACRAMMTSGCIHKFPTQ